MTTDNKSSNVYLTVRLNITAEEHKAFKIWCIEHDTTMSEVLSGYIREVLADKSDASLASTIGRMTPFEKAVCLELERTGKYVVRSGWPDFGLTMADGRHAFIEVKSDTDKLAPHQMRTLKWLTSVGLDCYVLYVSGKNKGLKKIKDGELVPVEYSEIAFDPNIFTPDTE